jgi:hypothetical protein
MRMPDCAPRAGERIDIGRQAGTLSAFRVDPLMCTQEASAGKEFPDNSSGTPLAILRSGISMHGAMFRLLIILTVVLAGCASLPPTPQDIEAKRFEPAPGKAVIYVVREYPDISRDVATLMLDDRMMGSTYPGTYFRWVVDPGRHEIRGYAGDAGKITLDVGPDRIYFIQQSVSVFFFGFAQSFFRPVPEAYGREAVLRSQLVGG